ncbi:MAG: alkaline shock response membrane anchor protein AmaP, partial [Nonomuraea sp.]|nr:alkaline shock response membrane anchor protein AmaP [Nonomuraea sp.]
VGGLGLLLMAVLPGRSRLVPIETGDPLIVIGITRVGLRRTLRAVAQEVEGVQRAKVRLRRRTIEVTVTTGPESSGSMLRQVGTAVGDRLAGVGALCGGEVVVRLRRKGL